MVIQQKKFLRSEFHSSKRRQIISLEESLENWTELEEFRASEGCSVTDVNLTLTNVGMHGIHKLNIF